MVHGLTPKRHVNATMHRTTSPAPLVVLSMCVCAPPSVCHLMHKVAYPRSMPMTTPQTSGTRMLTLVMTVSSTIPPFSFVMRLYPPVPFSMVEISPTTKDSRKGMASFP